MKSSDVSPGDVILASHHNNLRDDIYSMFIDLEASGVSQKGTGSFAFTETFVSMTTQSTSGTEARLLGDTVMHAAYKTYDNDFYLDFSAMFDTPATFCYAIMGIAGDELPTSLSGFTSYAACFYYNNGTLYAYHKSSSGYESQAISGITVTDYNRYGIEYDQSAGEYKFYVNESLKYTTTNASAMPSNQSGVGITFGIKNNNAVVRTLYVANDCRIITANIYDS